MKTLRELLKETADSRSLLEELEGVSDKEAFEAFLRRNDCGATFEELIVFLNSHNEGEISDDCADAVAGGNGYMSTTEDINLEEEKACISKIKESLYSGKFLAGKV